MEMTRRFRFAGVVATLFLAIATSAAAQTPASLQPTSEEVRKILSRALDDVNHAEDGEAKVAALQTILRLQVHAGNSVEALRQTDALNKPSESRKYVVCEVAIAMVLHGEGRKALGMLDEDPDVEYGDWCYEQMGSAEA